MRRPIVPLLIVTNVIVFFMLTMNNPAINAEYGIIPALIPAEPWRLITSMFLHANLMHIFFNMWVLWSVGPILEEELGSFKFTLLYLLGGFGGSLLVWQASDPHSITVGASGAIFSLFGALLIFSRKHPEQLRGAIAAVAINLVFTFASPGISWQGHIGGLIAGIIVALILESVHKAGQIVTKKDSNQIAQ